MIQKTIKYKDYNGVEREEDFYFHLTKADLIDLATEEDGDFLDRITAISQEEDPIKIIPIIKNIIIKSYGVKTPDGRGFIKDEESVKNFQYTEAFSELYTELATEAQKTAEFINGVMPHFDDEMKKQIDNAVKQLEDSKSED